MLIAVLLLGLCLCLMLSILLASADCSARKEKVTGATENFDSMAITNRFPAPLANRVRRYFQYCAQHDCTPRGLKHFELLPEHLQHDMQLFLYSDIVQEVPFFRAQGTPFIIELVKYLQHAIHAPREFIMVEGDRCLGLFFVFDGDVEELKSHNKAQFRREVMQARYAGIGSGATEVAGCPLENIPTHLYEVVGQLPAGSYFGQRAIATPRNRIPTSFTTKSFVRLLELRLSDVENLLESLGVNGWL